MKFRPACLCLKVITAYLLTLVFSGSYVWSQLPVAQLRSIFPAGGQAGQTVTFSIVEGSDLEEISRVIFNHPGIQLQGKLDPLTNPKSFTVKIAADVPSGYYSLRVQSRYGVSNPRMFRVDVHPGKVIQEADLQKESPLVCAINSVVYSRCEARGDIDEFAFTLEANKKYEVRLDSISLDSLMLPVLEIYQPDGHRIAYARQIERDDPHLIFSPKQTGVYRLKVYDFLYRGAASYAYRLSLTDSIIPESFNPPVLQQASQQVVKGVYQFSNADSDVVLSDYTLQPFPLQATSPLTGYISPRQSIYPFMLARITAVNRGDSLFCLPLVSEPLLAEQEPNNTNEKAQKLTVPSHVYGRFLNPGDVDIYSFQAKKGEPFWLQIFSERDGQSLDPFVKLEQISVDAKGAHSIKPITVPDDIKTNLYPNVFDTLSDDIDFLLKAPVDTTYRVTVFNRYHLNRKNRLDYYRLRIASPKPTFQSVAMVLPNVTGALTADTPSGAILRQGGTAVFKVLLNRIQGFAEPVRIEATHTPPGVTIKPIVIAANATSGELILRATADASVGYAGINLVAKAVDVNDPNQVLKQYKSVPVTPVAITWKAQSTSPAVSRLGHSLMVSIIAEQLSAEVRPADHPAILHVSQAEQVWQPLEIIRRNGFADKVIVKAEGIDKKAKIDVVAAAVPKEKNTSNVRFSFKADAKTGWHVCRLKSESQFNYVRNPQLLARTEQEYKKKEAEQTALSKTNEVTKKQQADKTKQLAEANKVLAKDKKKQQAVAKQIDTQNKMLAKLKADLQKSENEEQKVARQKLVDAKMAELTKLAKDQETILTAIKTSTQKVATFTAELKTVQEAFKKSNTAFETAKKSLAVYKKTLDNVRKQQAAKKTKYEEIEDRLLFYVHPAPMTISLKSPAEISLAKGKTAEVKIELARKDKVTGMVAVSLTLPPGIKGISASPVMLMPDQKTAVITINAAADATKGKHQFCTVRGSIMHESQQLNVDVPLIITVP